MNINIPTNNQNVSPDHLAKTKRIVKIIFWFFTGAFLSFFFILSFGVIAYQKAYENRIYPGIYINNLDFGGKTKTQVIEYFSDKNSLIKDSTFVFTSDFGVATVSAKQLDYGFDDTLSADQAYSLGRSKDLVSNVSLILQANINGINLPPSYKFNRDKLAILLKDLEQKINKEPINALFKFENNRVTTFRPSADGRILDLENLNKLVLDKASTLLTSQKKQTFIIKIPIKVPKPDITTEKVNNLGIKELIGVGNSLFYHSIPGRIHNVNLATSRINGVLISPNEEFSFNKALGDVTAYTGYKQAYVIQNGKTVLGDGGGVCQVSTTFFRAILNAGLPITERHAHAYRVGYYEENSPPGIDATIFVPSVDLKFKNDTGHYILVQSEIDLENLSLAFYLYGTKDDRTVSMTTPVISSQSPPPAPSYQDDPTLPKGEIKQTDFAAWGANVSFSRTVTKNGKTIIDEKFVSNYRPWQATYLRGTKE